MIFLFTVDNCCKDRGILNEILPDATIHQDLWHATQRVKRAVTIKCSRTVAAENGGNPKQWRKTFKSEFMKIFRQSDDEDISKPRIKTTPCSEEMLLKFDRFIDQYVKNQNIPDNVVKELNNLRVHIAKGCLSDQPPKCGTNKNENIHKHINAFFTMRGPLSVQAFEALIDTFIFETNKSIASKKGISLDFDSVALVHSVVNKNNECANDESSVSEESVLLDEKKTMIVENVRFLCEARLKLETIRLSRSAAQQLLVESPFTHLLPFHGRNTVELLNVRLRELKLETVTQSLDLKECLLSATNLWLTETSIIEEKSLFASVLNLLKLEVDYYLRCGSRYSAETEQKIKDTIMKAQSVSELYDQFDQVNRFIVDSLLIRAYANVRGCIVLIITSNPISSLSVIVPLEMKTNQILCFAYTLCESEIIFYVVRKLQKLCSCSCGWNKSKGRQVYCNMDSCSCFKSGYSCFDTPECKCNRRLCHYYQEDDAGQLQPEIMVKSCKCGVNDPKGSLIQRCAPLSRCKCAREKKSCEGCRCHGCGNKYGARKSYSTIKGNKMKTKLTERKRKSLEVNTFSMDTDIHKLTESGLTIKDTAWFFSETVLISDLKRQYQMSTSKLCKLYNYIISKHPELGRLKTESEVIGRVKNLSLY